MQAEAPRPAPVGATADDVIGARFRAWTTQRDEAVVRVDDNVSFTIKIHVHIQAFLGIGFNVRARRFHGEGSRGQRWMY